MSTSIWKISTIALASALTLVVSTGLVHNADAEPQPQMRSAVAALQYARDAPVKADGNKGGHRARAIALTDKAIAETQEGITYDNRN